MFMAQRHIDSFMPPAGMCAAEMRSYEARMQSLGDAVAFVEEYCTRTGISRADALRLAFIVEELFTNTVTHGYGGDCHSLVQVSLRRDAGSAQLVFEDAAPEHNPLSAFRDDPASLTTTLQLRPVGGLGMYLIGKLIGTAKYARIEGQNRVELALPLEA